MPIRDDDEGDDDDDNDDDEAILPPSSTSSSNRAGTRSRPRSNFSSPVKNAKASTTSTSNSTSNSTSSGSSGGNKAKEGFAKARAASDQQKDLGNACLHRGDLTAAERHYSERYQKKLEARVVWAREQIRSTIVHSMAVNWTFLSHYLFPFRILEPTCSLYSCLLFYSLPPPVFCALHHFSPRFLPAFAWTLPIGRPKTTARCAA